MGFLTNSNTAEPEQWHKPTALVDAPGRLENDGKTIVWGGTSTITGLTDREIELVKKKLKTQTVDYLRTEQVKALMETKTCAEIVMHFRGKKGYRSSTIKHTHAALSQYKRELARKSGAK